jgi:hypothetical protein
VTEKADRLADLKAKFKIAYEWWDENRKLALEDIKFRVPGNQWPAEIRKTREDDKVPCLEVDKTEQYLRQVVNDGRQNRPAIKVNPEDDGHVKVAEGLADLIRAICNKSNADESFDTALNHAVGNGFGFFRLITEYAGERTFNQEIRVRRVRNPLSVLLAPHSLADGSDAAYGFVIDEIPKDKYKKQYPNAKETDWQDSGYTDGWMEGENVRIVEFFYKEETTETMHLLIDNSVVSDAEYKASDMAAKPVETRTLTSCKVKWCRASGAEILEENDWLGKYIPIIPVYGEELDVEGKVFYIGMLRRGKDAQRLHNYSRSAFAQRVALTPKAPWLIAEGQIEGREDEWGKSNSGTVGALVYKATDVAGHPVPPPSRVSPVDVPAGFSQDAEMSEHDLQAAFGMYNASLGERSNEKSGKAIMARQREGDTSTFHFQDNLNRAVAYLGRQLVDLAPKVMDSRRMAQILGEDGTARMIVIDPNAALPYSKERTPDGREVEIYNFKLGSYGVVTSAGPSYTTKRQEAAEMQMQLVQANPTMWQTHGDLIAQNQDWPGADKWAERSRMALPPELREPDGDNPEAAAAMQQVQQLQEQAQQEISARDQEIAKLQQALEAEKAKNDAAMVKAEADMMRAEAEKMRAEAELNRPDMTPDTSASDLAKAHLEYDKIDLERERMNLEANTRVLVAEIGANAKAAAPIPGGDAENPGEEAVPGEEAEPKVDMSQVLLSAIEGFQRSVDGMGVAIQQMQRPRKILRDPQGNIAGVE